jgi:hypothetical protein
VLLVELLGQVGRLAEFTLDRQRLHPVRNARLGQRVRHLRSHPADRLMVLNCNHPAAAPARGSADGLDIHPVDKRVADDRRADLLFL